MNQIIIDTNIRESKVAIIENGKLVELYIEQHKDKKIIGNIYRGKVVNVISGMQAAFVDIGLKKNAYLPMKGTLKSGQDIVVQVVKEGIGSKGAKVTEDINLSGKHSVLMPCTNYIGISAKIRDDKKREQLKEYAKKYLPSGMGIILRTSSKNISEDELRLDIEKLLETFSTLKANEKLGIGSKLIYEEANLVGKVIKNFVNNHTDKIIVNNKNDYESIQELLKTTSLQDKLEIEYIDDVHDMFGYFKIDSKIKIALDRKVFLKNGAYLVIDETEALTAIDINTGKYIGDRGIENTVLNTNLEAVGEIVKQLRLRNIGGIIIIDFIDMKNEKDKNKVLEKLKSELKKDRTKTNVYGMTQLGLVEMTRKKEEKSLRENLLGECPYCNGTGELISEKFVLSKIEQEVKRAKYHTNSESIIFRLNPSVIEYIKKHDKDYTNSIEKEYNIEVYFIEDDNIYLDDVKIFKLGSREFIKDIIDKHINN